jgi:hypothetical protein
LDRRRLVPVQWKQPRDGGQAVKVGKKVDLTIGRFLNAWQRINDRLRLNFFLNVNRYDWNGEIGAILFVLAFPHELRVKRRVARIEHCRRRGFILCDEITQFFRGDVHSFVFMTDGFNRGIPAIF